MSSKIKVLLVDDSEVVRQGLRSILSFYPEIEVIGEAENADKAIQLTKSDRPEVVLMDIRMPQKSGIEACREISAKYPATSVIMLTSYDDDETIYEAIMAGASGYILKEISSKDLVKAIRQVAGGKSLIDPAITAKLLNKIRNLRKENKINELTEQEKNVLGLIAKGMTNKEIAKMMVLSEKTVRNYVSQILAKLEVNNRAEAAAYAVRNHLDY
ncbi:DNA-binding response regulator [Vulcanibacillus modesticaldus]|uniref:DNA-binding response regulator n=1 Tax=Vulcanibacillus modesticaldus TaxID=337097 RepID=A0A1D2YWL8_9BACI|nr:response regulator transcription factor [Vulcanibacillus modesticaldus]OEG00109.1 DNA-binding response regulator [Vulcanibacillus modesticaldus]